MPIYEYRCAKGHEFEVFQSMSEEPVASCIECGAASERVLSAPAVHFKGSGFYTTDYARKAAKQAPADGGSSEKGTSGDGGDGDGKRAAESAGGGQRGADSEGKPSPGKNG